MTWGWQGDHTYAYAEARRIILVKRVKKTKQKRRTSDGSISRVPIGRSGDCGLMRPPFVITELKGPTVRGPGDGFWMVRSEFMLKNKLSSCKEGRKNVGGIPESPADLSVTNLPKRCSFARSSRRDVISRSWTPKKELISHGSRDL